ncbi:MAG TPA: hypothetical protein VMS98_03815 [Thermoanaerobaculia bacterium]|nr:hypothetical protein [Thermoanaerobaculia bacterium]
MKLSITDIVRRGFDNVIANWPLILIRIAEGLLFLLIVVVSVVAAIVPVVMSIGLNRFDPADVDDGAQLLAAILIEHWPLLLYLFALVTVMLLAFIVIHSFVEAGCAAVYVGGERRVPATSRIPSYARNDFRVFTGELWFRGGRQSWWQVFWIYNIAWGVAGLIILIPLVLCAVVMLMLRETPGAMAVTGCLGMVLALLILIVVGVITAIWCQKAIVVTAATRAGAASSLRTAWTQFTADAGRHVAVAVIMYAIMMAGIFLLSTFSAFTNLSDSAAFTLAILPMQIISSFVNTVFSAFVQSWFLACFAGLTVEASR